VKQKKSLIYSRGSFSFKQKTAEGMF